MYTLQSSLLANETGVSVDFSWLPLAGCGTIPFCHMGLKYTPSEFPLALLKVKHSVKKNYIGFINTPLWTTQTRQLCPVHPISHFNPNRRKWMDQFRHTNTPTCRHVQTRHTRSNCSPTHFITKTTTDLNNTWYGGVLDKHCQANLIFYFHLFIIIPTLY